MAEKVRRSSGVAALLILLALASFAAAAITITNITEWTVRAKYPPIVKVKGEDADTTDYIYTEVTKGINEDEGTNRTYITITGFRGDPTNYTEIIKICNLDSVSYNVELKYGGSISGSWDYVRYIKLWIARQGPLTITSEEISGSAATTIPAGQCASVAVEVLVDGGLPDELLDEDLLTIVVYVVSTKP